MLTYYLKFQTNDPIDMFYVFVLFLLLLLLLLLYFFLFFFFFFCFVIKYFHMSIRKAREKFIC